MEKNRDRQAALRDCAGGRKPDGVGRPVGELALARGRMGAQLRDHHHHAERIMRGTSQPHAGGPEAGKLGRLAGEEPADASSLKAMLAPFPSDEMTCWPV